MPLTNIQTGQPPAPRNPNPKEGLQALAEQSQTALENTMLKQTLTEYLEQFKILKEQQNDFLRQAEARYQQDKKMLEMLQTEILLSNKALTDNIERECARLKDSLLQSATKSVMAGLDRNISAFEKAIRTIENKEAAAIKKMGNHLKTFDEQAGKLFAFDSVKQYLFWAGCVSNATILILLLFR